MPHGELTIPVRFHRSGLWVGIFITVQGIHTLFMVLDTGSPVSAISPQVREDLRTASLLQAADEPRYYRLSDVAARGTDDWLPLLDLDVRVLPRLSLLGIEGLLGLDFFRNFGRVCFHLSDWQIVLEYPPASA
jgi:hypothetical protein